MFDDIGKKIKSLAKAAFVIDAIGTVVGGFVLLITGEGDTGLLGLSLMPVGIFVSWASALILYGFGELVDKACDIERNTHKEEEKHNTHSSIPNNADNSSTVDSLFVICPSCNTKNQKDRTTCWRCESELHQEITLEKSNDSQERWICYNCKRPNLSYRTTCWCCGTAKSNHQ